MSVGPSTGAFTIIRASLQSSHALHRCASRLANTSLHAGHPPTSHSTSLSGPTTLRFTTDKGRTWEIVANGQAVCIASVSLHLAYLLSTDGPLRAAIGSPLCYVILMSRIDASTPHWYEDDGRLLRPRCKGEHSIQPMLWLITHLAGPWCSH